MYEGLSNATVWLVDVNCTSDGYPNGFAFAKVDTVARCRKELERHATAKAHRMIRDYIPDIIYPDYSTGSIDEEWGFVVYQPAHNVRRSSSLAGLIRQPENQQRSALVTQITKLLGEVVSHWYSELSDRKRETIDVATIFKLAFNVGDEELPPDQQRLATLQDRTNEYFGLVGGPKILEIPIDGGLPLPNPISLMMNLKEGEFSVSGYLVPAHGECKVDPSVKTQKVPFLKCSLSFL